MVRHIGLLPQGELLAPAKAVAILDMNPPLRASQPDESGVPIVGQMAPDLVGFVELNDDEARAVQANIEDIRRRVPHSTTRQMSHHAIRQYVALPAFEDKPLVAGGPSMLKCSCVGFVLLAYRDVIQLIDDSNLPPIPLNRILEIWPINVQLLQLAGLRGQGPWPVHLPGYVFHAMGRERKDLPYRPRSGDEHFDATQQQ
ncbi:MAG: hypothetical protein HOW73_39135 [Polyangiaceae bacterium]|nr:hypothetical protein [Polyangiaceae bacterium]